MKFIIIGSSTGGPRVLFDICEDLPVLNAVTLIIQHMPPSTTIRLARRLSQLTGNEIIVPEKETTVRPGAIYLAPGDMHMILEHYSSVTIHNSEKVHFVRPSIDVTMTPLKADPRHEIVGVILTGMGMDGAEGLAHLKEIGGTTIVQEPRTCTIRSMPEAALKTEKVDLVLTPAEIKKYMMVFGQS